MEEQQFTTNMLRYLKSRCGGGEQQGPDPHPPPNNYENGLWPPIDPTNNPVNTKVWPPGIENLPTSVASGSMAV